MTPDKSARGSLPTIIHRGLSLAGDERVQEQWTVPACILALPFLLFHWMLPFVAGETIGNDYSVFAPRQQLALAFSLKMGSHPLYVPGFAGGQSAAALTLGQLYHPISWIARRMPGYWDGYALEWNSLLRLISLGVTNLLLYALLRRMGLSLLLALGLSMITTYNLRMLDLFRYGPALESWTATLALCAAFGLMHSEPTRRRWNLLAVGSTYCLLTSGHPQMAYYGGLGAMLFLALVPGFLHAVGHENAAPPPAATIRIQLKAASCCGVGFLLALPYILPFSFEFLRESANRAGQPYAWAVINQASIADIVNSFLLPLHAHVEGAFGSSPLYVVALFLPLLFLYRRPAPWYMWAAWSTAVVVLVCMMGNRTPVHYVFWRFFPLASVFRIPGRISMLLPPLFMLLLAWFLREYEELPKNRWQARLPLAIALVLQAGYPLLPHALTTDHTFMTAHHIRAIAPWTDITLALLASCGLATLLLWPNASQAGRRSQVCFLALTLAQTCIFLRFGTWVEQKKPTITFRSLAQELESSLDYRASPGDGMYSRTVWTQIEGFPMETVLGRIYVRCLPARSEKEALARLSAGRKPCEVVLQHQGVPLCSTAPCGAEQQASVILTYSSYNRVSFSVESPDAGVFVLGYPWSPRWTASVDGRPAKTMRANGAAIAVEVPQGKSQVEFRYRSVATVAGMCVSCTVLGAGLLFCAGRASPKRLRVWAAFLGLLPVAWFAKWYAGLYGGNNLNTRYSWHGAQPLAEANLAFWKPTDMSSVFLRDLAHFFCPSRAVDGDTLLGAITACEWEPWWTVDLGRFYALDSLVVRERLQPPGEFNRRPIRADVSSDQSRWTPVGTWSDPPGDGWLRLRLNGCVLARFVRLQASGTCKLALDEVRVFGREYDSIDREDLRESKR